MMTLPVQLVSDAAKPYVRQVQAVYRRSLPSIFVPHQLTRDGGADRGGGILHMRSMAPSLIQAPVRC